MFYIVEIEDYIRVEPKLFGLATREAVEKQLQETYEDYHSKELGEVIGVIPEMFNTPQLAHKRLTSFEVVPDMHTRKARIADVSDGFVALPGGFGTLEELFEILTWAQIGLHSKPVGLLNTSGFYDPLLVFLDRVEQEGFMYAEHNSLYSSSTDPDALLDLMSGYRPPNGLERWVERQ